MNAHANAQIDFLDPNGIAPSGSIGSKLLASGGDYNVLRPFIGADNRSYVSVRNGKYDDKGNPLYDAKLVTNAGALLLRREWEYIDSQLIKIAKPRLKLINSMRAAGMARSFPNAYNYSTYAMDRVSDIDDAEISMSPKSNQTNDRAVVDSINIPLPIIHKEFTFEAREIAISRHSGQPLSTTNLELGAEKVAEAAEKLVLGTWGTYAYGGGTITGLTNAPNRVTGAFLNPSVGGWTPVMLYNSVISMVQAALGKNQYGPFDLYYSTGLMQYMMRMFSDQYGAGSLIKNLRELPAINSVEMLDYLTGNQLLLVQRNPRTASVLVGMDMRVVQWAADGGETEKFRIMAMMIPLIPTDQSDQCGIVHYTGNATTV
jgi:uncharacterized linocin/CFP29 family protein